MDYKSHIALVDAETKCQSGNHHVYITSHPEALNPVPVAISHSSVVESTINFVFSQKGSGKVFALIPP